MMLKTTKNIELINSQIELPAGTEVNFSIDNAFQEPTADERIFSCIKVSLQDNTPVMLLPHHLEFARLTEVSETEDFLEYVHKAKNQDVLFLNNVDLLPRPHTQIFLFEDENFFDIKDNQKLYLQRILYSDILKQELKDSRIPYFEIAGTDNLGLEAFDSGCQLNAQEREDILERFGFW